MKAVIQVVNNATLKVENKLISQIGQGLVVYFCVEQDDNENLLDYFAKKIANMRIFVDENGKMNKSVIDVGGEILLVSQFTLAGDTEKGNRPSFVLAEKPERANTLYLKLGKLIKDLYAVPVSFGIFGADMKITQENNGPVTIIMEKK